MDQEIESTETVEAPAAPEYDGGKDISAVVDAAAKAIPVDDKPAEAPKLAGTDQTAEQQQKAAARAWKAYSEGKDVGDFDPATITLADFFKWELGYNALGKEHRRTFEQVMRNVPLAHHNEQRTRTLEDNLRRTLEESNGKAQTLEQYTADRKNLNKALMAATRGNFEPLKAVVEAYQQAMDADDQQATQQVPEGYVSQAQLQQQRAGEEAYNRLVTPHIEQLAKHFQYPAEQIGYVVKNLIEREPAEYLTEQRLTEILTIELPHDLEQLRERDPIKAAEPSPLEKQVAELQAQIATLSGKKIEQQNSQVKGIHDRKKAAPPGVATNPGGSNADVADFDDAKGAREWLRKH